MMLETAGEDDRIHPISLCSSSVPQRYVVGVADAVISAIFQRQRSADLVSGKERAYVRPQRRAGTCFWEEVCRQIFLISEALKADGKV
jgi:hypothetical protein